MHWFINNVLSQEGNLTIKCPSNFQYLINDKNEEVTPIGSNDRLKSLLGKSGLFQLEIGFSPSSEQEWKKSGFVMASKIETINAYGHWMQELINAFGREVVLVPDTNFIKRQYYSNFFKFDQINCTIGIPRLVLLEIENKYNTKQKSIKTQNPNLEEARKEVRESFSDMVEILKVKEGGGRVLPFPENRLIETFSNVVGKELSDAWIRRELYAYAENLRSRSTRKECIFLSSDLMNSMAANAEGLNTIYFYATDRIRYKRPLVSTLLYNTAVSYEYCSVYRNNDIKICDLQGMWEGKSPLDWKNEIIKIDTPS